MNLFLLDASALAKRFAPEIGTALVNHLFARVPLNRLAALMLGVAETMAALVRKRNTGQFTAAEYAAAVTRLHSEVLAPPAFSKLAASNVVIEAALPFLDRHNINSADSIVLQAGLELASQFRVAGNDLVLIAADRRLLRAAQSEGLVTFDPENQTQAELDNLIGL